MGPGNRRKELKDLRRSLESLEAENNKLKSRLAEFHNLTGIQSGIPVFLKVVELAGIGFFMKPSGQTTVRLSRKAAEILGLRTEHEIPVEDIKNLIPAEDRIFFEKALINAEKQGKYSELEFKIAKAEAEGREFRIISIRVFPIDYGNVNDNDAVICIVTDVTAQDKIKRDLQKAKDKADDLEKNKNMLLRHISHEIRTPMNAIIGYSEILNIGNLSYDQRTEYINTIKEQGIYLLRLVDDISEFARMETGIVRINKSPCNVELLLHEVITICNRHKAISNKSHLEIRVNYPEERDVVTYTDAGRLQQLIISLVRHSINHTSKGFIEIGYQYGSENRIDFYVKDTSAGRSREQTRKSFTDELTFFGKYEGSGLELTISRNLVKLLGGKIWIETVPDQGSTYSFTIPREEVPDTYHEVLPEEEFRIPPYRWKDKVVLIVEDDDVNYKFLEAVLHTTDVQLLRANTGSQAVELCRSSIKIDLILMDIKLPEMNGLEATKIIREFKPYTPIIAQSAFIMEDERGICLEAGMNEYIDKPINIKEFFEKLDLFLKES
ncbi:MAG: response regulator [Bacteroidales bacterium]|nr:response regulator [Bacteroidales bacterium]